MSGAGDEEMSIRAYLLGELPPDGQMRIEERLLVDHDYMEMLLIIEDELTDSYLRGTLSDRERTEFENYFLTTPARRRKLRMAKALRRYVENQQALPSPAKEPGPWRRFFGQRSFTPAWASAIAAVLLLGVALGIWLMPGRESLADKGRIELRAALHESPIEGRIAGFDWGPKRVTLGEQSTTSPTESHLRAERDF
jgi:anti-sigma factor RsiW